MYLEAGNVSATDLYQALVSIVSPRPIAWVTTLDKQGHVNLAPYSFYNVFSSNPPVVVFSPTIRPDLTKKDTLLNLEEVPEFVINTATLPLAHAVNESSRELPRYESEAEHLSLELVPSVLVKPPRLKASPAHLECRVRQIISLGTQPRAGNLVIGEVLAIYVNDEIIQNGKIDPRLLNTIGRLGGQWFCETTALFELHRPT
ncbi:MAG TPA: flavin reductase family protein [Gemmatales bacterium]|nr:flavin reductase family protein [Gemmatales bacterium]HMP16852.1 flavin reductase family protein [Gemmatales bacterium]